MASKEQQSLGGIDQGSRSGAEGDGIEGQEVKKEEEGCKTPTRAASRIVGDETCPPAPRKRRRAVPSEDDGIGGQEVKEEEEGCKTPIYAANRIVAAETCPPAPMKRRRAVPSEGDGIGGQEAKEENEGCKTPTGAANRIVAPKTCPPAPRIKRPEVPSSWSSNHRSVIQEFQFFEETLLEEEESLFQSMWKFPRVTKR